MGRAPGESESKEHFHLLRGKALENREKQADQVGLFLKPVLVLAGAIPLFKLSICFPFLFHSLGSLSTFSGRFYSNALQGLTDLIVITTL